MKKAKVSLILPLLAMILSGCSNGGEVSPTAMNAESNELEFFVNTERDLNDIATLKFEPLTTTNKEVVWTCEANEVFSLTGSTIKANKVGEKIVTATSVANSDLSVDINIKVIDPNVQQTYKVNVKAGVGFSITGLAEKYNSGDEVSFNVVISEENKEIEWVKVDETVLNAISDNSYKFTMPKKDVEISVSLIDKVSHALSASISPRSLEIGVGDEDATLIASSVPSNVIETPSWTILEGEEFISLDKPIATPNIVKVHAIKEGNAKVQVSYNDTAKAECVVTVKEEGSVLSIVGLPDSIFLSVNETKTLEPSLSEGTGTFGYLSLDESVASISFDGVITAHKTGNTTINVTCVENPTLSKDVYVEVANFGSKETPLSVSQTRELANKLCPENGDYSSNVIYTFGKAKANATSTGNFSLLDLEKANTQITINTSTPAQDVAKVNQHDEVIVKGHVRRSGGSLQFATNGETIVEIVENVRGVATITLGAHENAVVKFAGNEISEPLKIKNGLPFYFTIEPSQGYKVDKVLVNNVETDGIDNAYSFVVAGDTEIIVTTMDDSIQILSLAKYDIVFDLGTRKTPLDLTTAEEILATFVPNDEEKDIITSVDDFATIAGGGRGGASATLWYSGNMLKFGTGNNNGSVTLGLSSQVNRVKITGYTTDNKGIIQVGDSASNDWTEDENDNKTTKFTCSDMNLSTKANVEAGSTSTITLDFALTDSLKIATTNLCPFYITAIEFILCSE